VLYSLQILASDEAKAGWLAAHLPAYIDEGDVILFASQKVKVDGLVAQLQAMGAKAAGIHGDMDQVGGGRGQAGRCSMYMQGCGAACMYMQGCGVVSMPVG
jgi:hypothetical protein